jgi:sugar/nucleoside kinase (ribokinase family)
MPSALIVGHVTKDLIRVPGAPCLEQPGGSALYASRALAALGWEVTVLTKLAAEDEALLEPLREAGVRVLVRPSPTTTIFENVYEAADLGSRRQRVHGVAAPFEPGDLEGLSADLIHLGPLTGAELPLSVVAAARRRASMLTMDPQGSLRRVIDGAVMLGPWADAARVLALVDVVKTDELEADMIVGVSDPLEASRRLQRLGVDEVLVTRGERGSLVRWPSGARFVDAIEPRRRTDASGCGDTFLAAYVHRRVAGGDPVDSAWFAAAAASLKLEAYGPFAATEAEAMARKDAWLAVRPVPAEERVEA